MWQTALPWVALGLSGLGLVARVFLTLVRIALSATEREAKAWRDIAMMREQQMGILTGGALPARREQVGPSP